MKFDSENYCGGARQSPINIESTEARFTTRVPLTFFGYDRPLGNFLFVNHHYTGGCTLSFRAFTFKIHRKHRWGIYQYLHCRFHTWKRFKLGEFTGFARPPRLTSGIFDMDYVFSSFHFHWGTSRSSGSEHTLDGQQFAAEVSTECFTGQKEKSIQRRETRSAIT